MSKKGAANEGIYVVSGSVQAEQMVVGRYAKAEMVVRSATGVLQDQGLTEVSHKLGELLEAVKQNGEQLGTRDEVFAAIKQVATELSRKQPNKLALKALLDGIAESVRSVASVATAAAALKTAVLGFLT